MLPGWRYRGRPQGVRLSYHPNSHGRAAGGATRYDIEGHDAHGEAAGCRSDQRSRDGGERFAAAEVDAALPGRVGQGINGQHTCSDWTRRLTRGRFALWWRLAKRRTAASIGLPLWIVGMDTCGPAST